MKILLTFIVLFFSLFHSAFAEYTLSAKHISSIKKVSILLNKKVQKKGEPFRKKIIFYLNSLLKKENISEKNTKILELLLLNLSVKDVPTAPVIHDIVNTEFIFSSHSGKCNSNPCETSEDIIQIQGIVHNSMIKKIQINDYTLASYTGSTWEYNANIAFGNFKDGENSYLINYFGKEGNILISQNYTINKLPAKKVPLIKSPDTAPLKDSTPSPVVTDSHVNFLFSDAPKRCNSNPCYFSGSIVKIEGVVSSPLIEKIQINNYILNSYTGSTWEYNANTAYGNFKEGVNVYTINYLGKNNSILFTQPYVINKGILKQVPTTPIIPPIIKIKPPLSSSGSASTSGVVLRFSDSPYRCSSNPCNTSDTIIKIEGVITNSFIKKVQINNYVLQSYTGSTWEYNANTAFGNFKDGINTYIIDYLGEDGTAISSQTYTITKSKSPNSHTLSSSKENTELSSKDTLKTSDNVANFGGLPFDKTSIEQYWIQLLNGTRQKKQLHLYTYVPSLNSTAQKWSNLAVKRGNISHKVNDGDFYYDYDKKSKWMKDNGVSCKNINRITFSESIAYGDLTCGKKDCSNEVKNVLKGNFNFFMSEKGKKYSPHYSAIINSSFKTIGLGIGVEKMGTDEYRIYLTNHYCTTNTQ